MSLHFKTIRWMNLLSTGNQFTEVKLDKSPTTLIASENGSGKCFSGSTLVKVRDKNTGEIHNISIEELYSMRKG